MHSFNVIKKLGEGSFGTVYLCERKHNKLQVVLKEAHIELNQDQLKSAKNEVTILKSLNHPNIVQYHDSFISQGRFYIVMEYANKGTLYELIKERHPIFLPQQDVLILFCQILAGLHHIHSKNIIHRDLKCENIFLTGLNRDVVKIGDFGISKKLDTSNDYTKTFIGTANYLAPELCQGHSYNTKSDIWSLGCILYELCALERMFEGTVADVVSSMVDLKIKIINSRYYELELQHVLEKCLQSKPENRADTSTLMRFPILIPTFFQLGTNLGCIPNLN